MHIYSVARINKPLANEQYVYICIYIVGYVAQW